MLPKRKIDLSLIFLGSYSDLDVSFTGLRAHILVNLGSCRFCIGVGRFCHFDEADRQDLSAIHLASERLFSSSIVRGGTPKENPFLTLTVPFACGSHSLLATYAAGPGVV